MSEERRRQPRVELVAQVEVATTGESGEVHVLVATNLSASGLFLALAPDECPWLVSGLNLSLTIGTLSSDGTDPKSTLVRARGLVQRRTHKGGQPGAGIQFESIESGDRIRLMALIASAK